MRRTSILLCCTILYPAFLAAQLPVAAADAQKVTTAFDTPSPNSLKCFIEKWNPFLDFALRFQSGYVVHCRLGLFEGKKVTVAIYLRVTPEGKPPALFASGYRLPAITPDMPLAKTPNKLKQEIGLSGVVFVGEGLYSVDVLVMDDRGRSCRKHWKNQGGP